MYKLLDWIDIQKLDWRNLSANPNAIGLLEQNIDKIDWANLSLNPNAINLLEQNIDEIDWDNLSQDINAISLIEQNLYKINWILQAFNPNAEHIFEEKNINRIKFIEDSNSEELLEKNCDAIYTQWLLRLKINNHDDDDNDNNDYDYDYDYDDCEDYFWKWLSKNPDAIHILKKYKKKINYQELSLNPAIFEIDYNITIS